MRSVNKVILIGNLTRDPEMKETTSGQKVTTFGIATNREWVSNGERKQSTEFHEVVAWGKLAEICEKYLKKGKLVYLEGYLKTRSWEQEDGTKKFRTEVVLHDMIMLEKKSSSEGEEDLLPEMTEEAALEEESTNEENEKPSEEPSDEEPKDEGAEEENVF